MELEGAMVQALDYETEWSDPAMSDRPAGRRCPAGQIPPPPGRGVGRARDAWWTERHQQRGWRCMTCHPPDHLPTDAIRREGEVPEPPRPLL